VNSLNIDTASNPVNAIGAVPTTTSNQSASALSQSDFIELLVAQLSNQDPSEPMDPSQFMNQLAQFSMVSGVQELNDSFSTLAGKLVADQSIQAANLVGHDVLIPGGYGVLTVTDGIGGQLSLPDRSSDVTLKIYNEQGAEVRELLLGGHESGAVQFQWDGFVDDGSAAAPGNYVVTAEAMINGTQQAVEVSLEKRVESVTVSQDGAQTTLNLESGESVPLNQIQRIM
jgi:flagellar basal-body rod modification protein FlgD